jgi:hypothetical protein
MNTREASVLYPKDSKWKTSRSELTLTERWSKIETDEPTTMVLIDNKTSARIEIDFEQWHQGVLDKKIIRLFS